MENLNQTLIKYAEQYVQELKQRAPKNTGALANSINYRVTDNSIKIEMNSYGDFLDKGINGIDNSYGSIYSFKDKKPPISSISNYASSIGANPYALQNSIFKKGIRPTNFIQDTINENSINRMAPEIVDAILQDINNKLFKK
jgi:hypothetical protein